MIEPRGKLTLFSVPRLVVENAKGVSKGDIVRLTKVLNEKAKGMIGLVSATRECVKEREHSPRFPCSLVHFTLSANDRGAV